MCPPYLLHLGVDVEARVAELGDLLGQQLHAVHRVAEDDRLVDLQLTNKGHVMGCVRSVCIYTLMDEFIH